MVSLAVRRASQCFMSPRFTSSTLPEVIGDDDRVTRPNSWMVGDATMKTYYVAAVC